MGEVSRGDAWNLLCQFVESDSLRRHCRAVEAAMAGYAPKLGAADEIELWRVTGLLHDLDYERYPDLETGHPRYALEWLRERGYPETVVRAIASHADYMGVPRETAMERALYAVDELSGFVLAVAHVRPERFDGMTVKSVTKKLKTPAFAAAVNRDDIRSGAEALGVELSEHIATVIAALTAAGDTLMPAGG